MKRQFKLELTIEVDDSVVDTLIAKARKAYDEHGGATVLEEDAEETSYVPAEEFIETTADALSELGQYFFDDTIGDFAVVGSTIDSEGTPLPATQGYEKDQTPMSVSPDWKADGTGFRS